MNGPRIYNLFPLLVGTTAAWSGELDRIAALGFSSIYLNPVTQAGGSGSLYAVADYTKLDQRFDDGSGRSGDDQLRAFLDEARKRNLDVYMDLVINHTANDAKLTTEHPEWYRHEADGSITAPFALDDSVPEGRVVWGDLAELDFDDRPERTAMIAFFDGVVAHAQDLGFAGFRCDAAYKVPAAVWATLIENSRKRGKPALFLAETLGASEAEVAALSTAGFDYFFNSSKWWKFDGPWLIDQYNQLRDIAPSIAFPESHDTERTVSEARSQGVESVEELEQNSRCRYAFAACFSSGVMMPVGFEWGASKRVNVVSTTATDGVPPIFDISEFITQINHLRSDVPAFNEEGPQRRIDIGQASPVVLERRTKDGQNPVISVFNLEGTPCDLALASIANGESLREITPGVPAADSLQESIHFASRSFRIFLPEHAKSAQPV